MFPYPATHTLLLPLPFTTFFNRRPALLPPFPPCIPCSPRLFSHPSYYTPCLCLVDTFTTVMATYCCYILPLHTATPACRLFLLPCSSYYAVFHTFFGSRSCSPGNCHGVLLLACRIPPRYNYLFGTLYLNSLYITVSLVSTIYLDSSVNDCCNLFIHLT